MTKRFRQGVAAVILNEGNQILICQRIDDKGHFQFPQGGIHPGEDDVSALKRELREEIGTDAVTILCRLPHKTRYEWPDYLQRTSLYRGQEHRWFVVRLHENQELMPSDEFGAFCWIEPTEILTRTNDVRRQTYRRVMQMIVESPLNLPVRV